VPNNWSSGAFEALEHEVRRQVDSGFRPSIQIAVDWQGERVVDLAYGAGASSESTYVLWSSVKPVVAIAVLQVIEDDRIARTIPEFGVHGKPAATLLHLLTHRGGFPDNTPQLRRDMFACCRDWKAAVTFACEMPAAWEPGTDRGYHPLSSWFVLGEWLQRLDDRPLPEVLRRRILEPLGIPPEGFSLGTPEALISPPLQVQTSQAKGAPGQGEADFWNDPATHAAVIPGASGIGREKGRAGLHAYMTQKSFYVDLSGAPHPWAGPATEEA